MTEPFYSPEKQCPICYESFGNYPMFPVQFSFCQTSRKFKLTSCGHAICKTCLPNLQEQSCSICRYEASHYIQLDVDQSTVEEMTRDNNVLRTENRCIANYATEKRREAATTKIQMMSLKLQLKHMKESMETASSVSYISDEETYLDIEDDSDMDERPITSRYHTRNLAERINELRNTEASETEMTDDSNANTAATDATISEEESTTDLMREMFTVVLQRIRRLHDRVSKLEMDGATSKLTELNRLYHMKKYETLLLEQDILNLKKEYIEEQTNR